MGRRRVRLASEAAKFLTVGGLATFLSFVLFNILLHGVLGPGPMHEDPLVAFVIANTVGMAVSYRGSRSWAFQGRQVVGVAGGRLTFVVINVLSMTVPLACLSFARYVLHRSDPIADNLAANVVGLGLGTVVRRGRTRTWTSTGGRSRRDTPTPSCVDRTRPDDRLPEQAR